MQKQKVDKPLFRQSCYSALSITNFQIFFLREQTLQW